MLDKPGWNERSAVESEAGASGTRGEVNRKVLALALKKGQVR